MSFTVAARYAIAVSAVSRVLLVVLRQRRVSRVRVTFLPLETPQPPRSTVLRQTDVRQTTLTRVILTTLDPVRKMDALCRPSTLSVRTVATMATLNVSFVRVLTAPHFLRKLSATVRAAHFVVVRRLDASLSGSTKVRRKTTKSTIKNVGPSSPLTAPMTLPLRIEKQQMTLKKTVEQTKRLTARQCVGTRGVKFTVNGMAVASGAVNNGLSAVRIKTRKTNVHPGSTGPVRLQTLPECATSTVKSESKGSKMFERRKLTVVPF